MYARLYVGVKTHRVGAAVVIRIPSGERPTSVFSQFSLVPHLRRRQGLPARQPRDSMAAIFPTVAPERIVTWR